MSRKVGLGGYPVPFLQHLAPVLKSNPHTKPNALAVHLCCAMQVGKRASTKATYPGLLDVIAAGGQPSGLTFRCVPLLSLPLSVCCLCL